MTNLHPRLFCILYLIRCPRQNWNISNQLENSALLLYIAKCGGALLLRHHRVHVAGGAATRPARLRRVRRLVERGRDRVRVAHRLFAVHRRRQRELDGGNRQVCGGVVHHKLAHFLTFCHSSNLPPIGFRYCNRLQAWGISSTPNRNVRQKPEPKTQT